MTAAEIKEKSEMLNALIAQWNKERFSKQGVELGQLKHASDPKATAKILAKWTYDDWLPYNRDNPDFTLKNLENSFLTTIEQLEKEDAVFPLTFVPWKTTSNGSRIPVGCIGLSPKKPTEWPDYPDDSVWGRAFHVEDTGHGLGRDMAEFVVTVADRLGYPKVHFYTSKESLVPWYVKLGATILAEKVPHGNHTVTVMCASVKDKDKAKISTSLEN